MVYWKEYRFGVTYQILTLTSCVYLDALHKLSGLSTISFVTQGRSKIMHIKYTAQSLAHREIPKTC